MPYEPLPIRFYSLWAINGALDRERLCGQLEEFQALGLDGVVFHPRFYPGRPPYLSESYLKILDRTILHAKALGMRFWIYDENGWPSGTADGRLFQHHPEDVCQRLDMVKEPAGTVLSSFKKNGSTWHLAVQEVRGIDCFSPKATHHFLEDIHERYRQGLSPAAFDYVEAFFADEPESGVSWEPMPSLAAIPWSRRMLESLNNHFGSDVTSRLPLLFTEGEGSREFRVAYWELVTDLFCRGFLDPYRKWCEQHGKLFVGHVKGEEHPLFQLPMVGSCQRAYRHFSMPGIDALERYPTNHFYPRQASSVARQFGNGRCMVEANGGSGWASSPEDLQRYLVWLGQQGLTDFALHLSQYRLDSASLYDWPPSQPLHVSWREAYPEILKRVRREVAGAALAPRDTLVIAPYRGLMGAYEPWELWKTNIHDGDDYPMTAAGKINAEFLKLIEELHARRVAYDVTDERTFEESASQEDGEIRLGNSRYQRVVASPGAVLRETLIINLKQEREPSIDTRDVTSTRTPEPSTRVELIWSKINVLENALLLKPKSVRPGVFSARFAAVERLPGQSKLAFAFPDTVHAVNINGYPLTVFSVGDGTRAEFSAQLLRLKNEVTFCIDGCAVDPFVWLRGDFLVCSDAPYRKGGNSTIATEGPLRLAPMTTPSLKGELVAAGLPFAFLGVEADATFSAALPFQEIAFEFLDEPETVCVSGENGILGWAWGPDWTLKLAHPLPAGRHDFRVKCVPSSYNYYGPHHYYLGAGHVVSPAQVRGERNFADPIDAPAKTHVAAYHFRPWGWPSHIRLS